MPKDTRVDAVYQGLKKSGHSQGSAARIAQATTGESLMTGKKKKRKSHKSKKVSY